MWRYLLRRAVSAALLIVVAAAAAFVVTALAPSDCVPGAALDAEMQSACNDRAALGLDRPLLAQVSDWLSRLARLDLGTSQFYTNRPVSELVGERALNTALLASAALLLAAGIGIPLGIYTGLRSDGIGVRLARGLSLLMLSLPPLLASLLLVLLAARTGWLPVGGMVSAEAANLPWGAWLLDVAHHLPLPALALALPLAATLERLQSQSMREASAEPFVGAARARGVPLIRAQLRHGWPVSLASILALLGVIIGTLFSGSFIVEYITSWPGLGRLTFDALRARDLNLVVGCALAGGAFLAAGTLIADLIHASIDPRAHRVR